MSTAAVTIESTTDFKDDATGRAARWSNEMVAADKEVEKWLKEGTKIVDRFLDMRTTNSLTSKTRLNIFNSNITTLRGMLYGQVPGIDVKRRYDDANDDPARVAANILERMLNNDIDRDGDNYLEWLVKAARDSHDTLRMQRDFLDGLRIEGFDEAPNLPLGHVVAGADERLGGLLAYGHLLPTGKPGTETESQL